MNVNVSGSEVLRLNTDPRPLTDLRSRPCDSYDGA